MAAGEHLSKLTDEQIRDAFEKLKAIEGRASRVLDEVKTERASFNRRVYDEIKSRRSQLEAETAREINLIEELSQTDAEKRIAEIESDKTRKVEEVNQKFNANREAWRKQIFDSVLAGL